MAFCLYQGLDNKWRTCALLFIMLCFTPASFSQTTDCNANNIDDSAEFDSDGDGIINACDNCSRLPNAGQLDSDNDGYGNFCDADLDNSGFVSYSDLNIFADAFNSNDAIADFNHSEYVNFDDLAIFKSLYNKTPGPGANPNDSDDDGDGIIDYEDNCPGFYNPLQEDRDHDNQGDICDDSPVGAGINLENYGISWEQPSIVHMLTRALYRSDGSIVTDLQHTDFELQENGITVAPSEAFVHLESATEHGIKTITTVVLIDVSQSIDAADFPKIRAALKSYLQDSNSGDSKLLPGQSLSIYTFDNTVTKLIGPSSDLDALVAAVDQINQGALTTNLYGALYESLDDWENSFSLDDGLEFGNLIVITDGQDSTGQYQLAQIVDRAATKAVFTIAVGPEADTESLMKVATSVEQIDSFEQIGSALNSASLWLDNLLQDLNVIYYASSKRSGSHDLSIKLKDNPACGSAEVYCNTQISAELSAEGFSDVSPELRVSGKTLLEAGESAIWQLETLWSNHNENSSTNYSWTLADFYQQVSLIVDENDNSRATVSIASGANYALANITVSDLNYADLSTTITLRSGNGLLIKSAGNNIGQVDFNWQKASSVSLSASFAEELSLTPAITWTINNEPDTNNDTAFIIDDEGNSSEELSAENITLQRAKPRSAHSSVSLTISDANSGFSQTIAINNNSTFADYPTDISAGGLYSCAIHINGLTCWGNNDLAQTTLPPLGTVSALSTGRQHACALDENGVSCWGYNNKEQTDVPALNNPSVIAAGHVNSCAIDNVGLHCWGYNIHGQSDTPTLNNPSAIAIGGLHLCALDDNGVHCWGYNAFGETVPPPLSNPRLVSAGYRHTCALDDNGVHCWGYNSQGQTDVPQLSNPSNVITGNQHSCAIDDNGLHCWGDNSSGQTDVPALSNVISATAGDKHSCALDDNGVHCWGSIEEGQSAVPNIWGWL